MGLDRRSTAEVAYDAMDQENYARATRLLTEHLADDPEDGRAHAKLAQCLLNGGLVFSALAESEQALKYEPDNVFSHIIRARVAEEMDDYQTCDAAIKEALRISPDSVHALVRRCYWYSHKFEHRKLRETAQIVVEKSPDNFMGHYFLAMAAASLGNGVLAEEHARQALRLDANSAKAHLAIGWAFLAQKKASDARDAALSALSLAPELHDAHLLLVAVDQQRRPVIGWLNSAVFTAMDTSPIKLIKYWGPILIVFMFLLDTLYFYGFASTANYFSFAFAVALGSLGFSFFSLVDKLGKQTETAELKLDY